MHNTKEHFAQDQMACPNCEEIIHSHALQCPYCESQIKQPLHEAQTPSQSEKITPLLNHISPNNPYRPAYSVYEEPAPTKEGSVGSTILSLCLLFGGCNFVFLGLLIGLFSKNGYFTLNWSEVHWPLYFGAGIALTTLGLCALKNVEPKNP